MIINAPEISRNPYLIESIDFASAGGIPNASQDMKTKGQIYLKRKEFEVIGVVQN